MTVRFISTCFLTISLIIPPPILAAATKAGTGKEQTKNTQSTTEAEPKFFFWGILANALLPSVFSAFEKWLAGRLSGEAQPAEPAAQTVNFTPLTDNSASPQDLKTQAVNRAASAVIVPVGEAIASQLTRLLDAVFTGNKQTEVAKPKAAFQIKDDVPNFQAVHIAIVPADRDGNLLTYRPVSQGFQTGERFKLRVIATFSGMLAIGNINPSGAKKQIYPPTNSTVVSIEAGKEAFIPLGKDEFFEFAGVTGTEQLVVTVLDPRALGEAASPSRVFRQDEAYGSNFAQHVTAKTYPAISESISLIHYSGK
jgi:hypothetical protein